MQFNQFKKTMRINASYECEIGGRRYYVDINTTNGVGAARVGSHENPNSTVGDFFINSDTNIGAVAEFIKDSVADFESQYGKIETTKRNDKTREEK